MFSDKENAEFYARAKSKFEEVDANHDGCISVSELQAVKGLTISRKQAEAVHKLMLASSSKELVEFEDFLTFAHKRRVALKKAFDSIRNEQPEQNLAGRDPCFTASQLKQAAARAGTPLTDGDIRNFMHEVDQNHDGYVTFDEFVACTLMAPHVNPYNFFDHYFVEAFDASTASSSDFSFCSHVPRREGEGLREMVTRKMTCGGAAGILSGTLTAPIDRIRLLMMTNGSRLSLVSAYRKAISHSTGFRALWMGNGVNCVKIAPEMGIKLYCFDHFKSIIARDIEHVSPTEQFIAGGCAGAVAEVSSYPMDVLRTRLATGMYSGVRDCAISTWQTGGARAFLAGLSPSIAGIVPYASIDLGVNALLKQEFLEEPHSHDTNVPLLLACGMTSSATAAVFTFPIVVVRIQAQATGNSIRKVIRGLWKEGEEDFIEG